MMVFKGKPLIKKVGKKVKRNFYRFRTFGKEGYGTLLATSSRNCDCSNGWLTSGLGVEKVVMENGELSTCGRCIHVPGLCDECGYFFAAEYALVFRGNLRVITEMLRTYTRYV